MSSIDSFNNRVILTTPFKKLAFNKRTGKYTAAYRKFLRENNGIQQRQTTDDFTNLTDSRVERLPLRPGDVFNPGTQRIVKRKTMYLKPKAKTPEEVVIEMQKPTIIRAAAQRKLIQGYLKQLNAFYNAPPRTTLTVDLGYLTGENLFQFVESLRTDPPVLVEYFYNVGPTSNVDPKRIYTITAKSLESMKDKMFDQYHDPEAGGSDDKMAAGFFEGGAPMIRLTRLPGSTLQQGAFFKYTLNHEIPDVEQYGLYRTVKASHYRDCCFVNALVASGVVPPEVLEKIRLSIKTAYLPMKKIREIAEQYDLHIVVRGLATKSKRLNEYGNRDNVTVEMGLVGEHYFFNGTTSVTSYALKHYAELKHKPQWNEFVKKNERDATRFISAVQMFKLLVHNEEVKNQFLTPIKMTADLFATPHYQKVDEFPALDVQPNDYRPVIDPEASKKSRDAKAFYSEITKRVWFDFETNVYSGAHTPYLGWYAGEDGETEGFVGQKCAFNMLCKLYKLHGNIVEKETNGKKHYRQLLMIAHNAGYDWTTGLFKHLSRVETIEKGSGLMTGRAVFYYPQAKGTPDSQRLPPLEIVVQCSYAKIPEPLRKFGKMFQLKQEKEVMPYPVYNTNNIARGVIPLKECLQALKRNEREQFVTNCNRWGCLDGSMVNIIEYSSRYCEMDCVVLRAGYLKFQKLISEICDSLKIDDMNIDHFISAASIADEFIKRAGCYEGCVEMCGVPRAYIQRCLVGGRTMMNSNTQHSSYGKPMDDFDAVSLYPSAMNRLRGFLKGAPKTISSTDYATLCDDADGFYVRVKVTKVGTHRAFPLMSFKDEKGVRVFSNDMVGKTVYIDDVALADAVEFQGVEFEIIDGYMFNEGFNDTIVPTIRHLFDARLKAKKAKNPVQAVIKLVMNSCYGKCALKEIAEDVRYVSNNDLEKFVVRHYNWVKEVVPNANGRGYRVKLIKAINTHFNRVHIAIQILSMSKRIMNEVMCLADDVGVKIFYQDTDSTHLLREQLPTLTNAFTKKYGREILGNDMGQFNCDFEIDGCENVYADKSIFLAKKCYIDCLVGTDSETGETKRDFHIRLKGVPNSCILGECKKRKCTPLQLYETLKAGEAVKFNLLIDADGDRRVRFKKNSDTTMTTVDKFERVVQFA